MVSSLNLHHLFSSEKGYLAKLQVSSEDRRTLRDAREQIRGHLRGAFANWGQHVQQTDLLVKSAGRTAANFHLPVPKFRLQGSFAYHTVNDRQQNPQQIDQDDGLFLPITFVTNSGKTHPIIASKAYFAIVESALAPLCRANGWKLNPTGKKDNCVRVEISETLHIDIPLYAIKDDAYARLTETVVADSLHKSAYAYDSEELADSVYTRLAEAEILLADRDSGWIESDPRKLEQWFETAVKIFGPQVRRLSRIYKGMRDFHWKKCDLGSLCIMAAVVKAMRNVGPLDDTRDDLALLIVGQELVRVLVLPVENPAFPGETDKYLCKDWPPEFRSEVRRVISTICESLDRALNRNVDKDRAILLMQQAFGGRIPNDRDLVRYIGAAATIREVAPTPQPKPYVPRTRSG
jgi:hypothetical protein